MPVSAPCHQYGLVHWLSSTSCIRDFLSKSAARNQPAGLPGAAGRDEFDEQPNDACEEAPCVSVVAAWIESVIPGALEDTHGSLRTTVQRRGGGPLAATRELVA